MCPFHIGLNMFNEDSLFFHQQENVNEQVMELLHAGLKAQQLLLVRRKDETMWDTSEPLAQKIVISKIN